MSGTSTIDRIKEAAEHKGDPQGSQRDNPLVVGFKRLKANKFLLGLVIVCMLGIFVGGVCTTDDPHKKPVKEEDAANVPETAKTENPAPAAFTPALATDFVKWWVPQAMDYSVQTAKQNHTQAFTWMDQQAAQAFQSCFWTPDIEASILNGRVAAAFQPVTVQAEAINPDGSIVVGVTGTLVMQCVGSAPVTTQIAADFLVRKEATGLRVGGLYNRTVAAPAAAAMTPTMAPAPVSQGMYPSAAPAAPMESIPPPPATF